MFILLALVTGASVIVAATAVTLVLVQIHANEFIESMNKEARAIGMNKVSGSSALQEKPL